MRTKKVKEGNVYSIRLNSEEFVFALVCAGKDFAFFDYKADVQEIQDGIQNLPLAFRVPVSLDGPSKAGWELIGKVTLEGVFNTINRYVHKPIGSNEAYLYQGGETTHVEPAELKDLEILSTWFPMHIEERLADYFNGIECKYVISMKKHLGL